MGRRNPLLLLSLPLQGSLRCCTHCLAIYRAEFARCPTDGALLELRDDDPLIGTTVGEHYLIDAVVGEGGMGRVYRAHHTRLHRRQFAIKILLGDLAATIATRMRFAQEADAASRLDHPNVVPVVDFGKTETGLMYLAMELVHGRTLATLIEEEAPLAADRVIGLSRQLALGLAHAHGRSLVHRDFKPDNIIVVESETGEVPRILDFGLAIAHDEETSARLTSAGLAFGTPLYAAPEQTHGEVVDERADQFSFGITMYEMLTGKTPHDGTAFDVIRLNAREAPPPMASRANVSVPPALEALVARLVSRRADDRFPSTTALIAALDSLATTIGNSEAATTMPSLQTPDATLTTLPSLPSLPTPDTTMLSLQTTSAETAIRPRASRSRVAYAAIAIGIVLVAGIAWLVYERPATTAPATARSTSSSPPTSALIPASDPGASTPALTTPAPTTPPPTPTPTTPAPTTAEAPAPTNTIPLMGTTGRAKVRAKPRSVAAAPIVASEPSIAAAPEPTPTPIASVEPPIGVPPPPPDPAPAPVVPPAAPPSLLLTAASVGKMTTQGSLSAAVVRRAVERAMPEVSECARRLAIRAPAPLVIRASFVIDDRRRATNVTTTGTSSLATCVSRGLENVRTQDPPDVGTVAVSIEIRFSQGPT